MTLSRRSALGSLLGICLPSGVFAGEVQPDTTDDEQNQDPKLFAQLQRLVRPATMDINAGRVLKGINSLEQARAMLETAEHRNWVFGSYVNKPYGLALILIGQYENSIAPLKVAVEVERRMSSSNSPKIKLLTKGLDEGIVKELLRVEYGRQTLSNLEKTGRKIHEIKDLLLDQSTGTMDANELLLRAYAMTGNFAEAKALLDPQILESEGPLSQRDLPPVALEYRLMKMGAALSGAGDKVNAARAFDAALNVNFYRLRTVGEYVASPEVQLATYNVRRLVLSAALGNTDIASLSKDQSTALAQKIVETKGLGVRYAERLNRLLGLSKSSIAQRVRLQLLDIENQLSSIPDGQVELQQLFNLSLQRWKVVSPVMEELWGSGLQDVFIDGKSILDNARLVLGKGAMIGFMAYTPLSSEKFAFGSSRYIRFCVAGNDIYLNDIGSKAIVDKEIFKLRELILNDRPTSVTALKLSKLLLNDLPISIKGAKSWTIEPDGALNLLPFEVLPGTNGYPLIFSTDIGYVTSFGQVGKKDTTTRTGKARIIADPEFNNPPDLSSKSSRGKPIRGRRSLVRVVQTGATMDSMEVVSLPETRFEATAVESSLLKLGIESETYLGKRADVHALELTKSPRVLHVATHGVLIPPPLLPAQNEADPLGQIETYSMGLPGRSAGLAVSGEDKPVLVYASEIAQFPLQDTELVVLSACDSGNGTIDVGEGMASLRRAVEMAGASASVTSLWSVPSDETTKLMSSFYEHLAKGSSKRAALRQAKLDSIARNPDPYNWAGFVFAGQE